MLESIFVIMLVFAMMINLMGFIIGRKSMLGIVLLMIAIMLWLGMVMGNTMFIQVPGDTTYQDYGLNVFCPMFIFVDITFLIYYIMSSEGMRNWKHSRNQWRG